MIYVTGDKHGKINTETDFMTSNFKDGKNLTKNDYVIVLGDFGWLWRNPPLKQEIDTLKYVADKNWTTLVIDGNHENFELLNKIPETDMFGDKVGVVYDGIYHLKRGRVYEIDGFKCFTCGGAASVDKRLRTPGLDWWNEEIPSMKEMNLAFKNLEKHDWKTDYVFSHAAPSKALEYLFDNHYALSHAKRETFYDPVSDFLQQIAEKLCFKKWFFGHYHVESDFFSDGENQGLFKVLYHKVEKI